MAKATIESFRQIDRPDFIRRTVSEYATLKSASPAVETIAKRRALDAIAAGRSGAYAIGVGFQHIIESAGR